MDLWGLDAAWGASHSSIIPNSAGLLTWGSPCTPAFISRWDPTWVLEILSQE